MCLNSTFRSILLLAVVAILLLATQNNAEETTKQQQLTPIVQLNGGQVRGVVRETGSGKNVNFYQAIRFGQSKRFQKSTPADPWTGIYDANQTRGVCPQPGMGMPLFPGSSEDCLFLNVWQPAEPNANRSVMVWIHGGGFFGGTISQYDASGIAEFGDVLVVALSYRVGSLGFLSFGTEQEPGNLGLHDQILGLKWVQENIQKFGGNPQDVTIFGESAGGMSVGALVLSPLTAGLFHRAIVQSGAPNIEQIFESKQKSLKKTRKFAKQMNCTEDDMESIKKCLLEKSFEELVKTAMMDFFKLESFFPIYGDDLLPMSPSKLLEQPFNRELDLMFGVTRDEGTMFVTPIFPEVNMQNITLESAKEGIQKMLDRLKVPNASLVLDYYTKNLSNETSQKDLRFAVSHVLGDYLLVCPTILFGQKLALSLTSHNRHSYSYRVMNAVNITIPEQLQQVFDTKIDTGVFHGTDLVYLFEVTFLGGVLKERNVHYEQIRREMITAWTQFAKTGQISPVAGVQWDEAIDRQQPEQSSAKYFSLDVTDHKMVNNYWSETCDRVWKPILTQMQSDQ